MATQILTTTEAASALALSRPTVLRVCKKYPGFGFLFGGSWRIPADHILKVKAGVPVADIAAAARGAAH